MSRKGKRWILAKHFDGFPKETDVKLEEFDIPPLKDGEFLVEAEYLTVDPYMRPYSKAFPLGSTMVGQQVAKVIESRNSDYPVGTWTTPYCGWATHTVSDGKEKLFDSMPVAKIPPIPGDLPRSYALGTLGMPGITAYFGLLDVCEPKAGETVLVSGAAGAVGHLVGQIAKIKGCRVIGSAGSDDKLKWLKELGFDDVFNYKTVTDLDAKLKDLAPDGIDVYFDNVGGEFAATVIMNMRIKGRMAGCGNISEYNQTDPAKLPSLFGPILSRQLKVQGFNATTYFPRASEALTAIAQWIVEGKIKVREHVTTGFENMFTAFAELFTGANTGKAIVKI